MKGEIMDTIFNRLESIESDVFEEMDKINKQIIQLKTKYSQLRELARVMNPQKLKDNYKKVVKK